MQTPLPDELNVLQVYRNVPLKNAVKYENSEWTIQNGQVTDKELVWSTQYATIYSVQRYIKFFMVGDSSLCCQQNVMTFD